jgi:hypothetical protein
MTRRFPAGDTRLAYAPGALGKALLSQPGRGGTIYSDEAGTIAAAGLTLLDGTPIVGGRVIVDAASRWPEFNDAGDRDRLYGRLDGSTEIVPLYPSPADVLAGLDDAKAAALAEVAAAGADYVPKAAPQFPNGLLNLVLSGQTFGDSITYGVGASDSAHSYAELLADAKGWTSYTNYGVSGAQAWDQADQIFARDIAAGVISTYMIGANDERIYGAVDYKIGVFGNAHLAELVWLATLHAKKVLAADATTTGTWDAPGVYGGRLLRSFDVGAKKTFTAYGRTVYAVLMQQEANTSTQRVTVDGRVMGVYSTQTAGLATQNGRGFGPRLVRIPGLTDGPHTVEVENVTADGSNPGYFLFGAGSAGGTAGAGPSVFVGNITRQSAAGYAANGGSDATVALYNDVIARNVRLLQEDGLNVGLVDVSSRVDTTNMPDGIHPNDAGHAQIRDAFVEGMNPLLQPRERNTPLARHPEFVGVRLRRAAAYGVPSGALTVIPWDTEDFDTQGFHDPAVPGRVTIPPGQGGYFLVQGAWGPAGSGIADQKRLAGRLRVNGVDIPGGTAESDASGVTEAYPCVNASTALHLNAGDYLELATYHDHGSDLTLDLLLSAMVVTKLGI